MGVLSVGILGAGVVGLSTALELQKEFPTARYTVIADKFFNETTSEVAAGIFRPSNSFAGPTEQIADKWLRDSFTHYTDLLKSSEGFKAGMTETSGYYFSRTSKDVVRVEYMNKITKTNQNENLFHQKSSFLEGLVPIYRAATEEERNSYPGGWKYGSYFTTVVTECTKLLPWATHKFEQAGGKVKKAKVNSFNDVANDFDVVVNCLGLGAKYLCNDKILVPIRGQILRVNAPWQKHFIFADDDTYIIPRSDSVILGGTRNYDNYNLSLDKHDRNAIMEKCYAIVPRLAEAPIVSEWVGLRPHRTPVRVERETIRAGNKDLKVIHNYGHGGYGVTTAPGTAKYAVKLFMEQHSASGFNSKL